MIDKQCYFWIEEYPHEQPSYVLNGFIFALFELKDYYLLTESPEAKKHLQEGITTIETYGEWYRLKRDLSYYGLKHAYQSRTYHRIHTRQMDMLYRITHRPFFQKLRMDCSKTVPVSNNENLSGVIFLREQGFTENPSKIIPVKLGKFFLGLK